MKEMKYLCVEVDVRSEDGSSAVGYCIKCAARLRQGSQDGAVERAIGLTTFGLHCQSIERIGPGTSLYILVLSGDISFPSSNVGRLGQHHR
jgi:hypothetical protein